jgi:hypothetical protein
MPGVAKERVRVAQVQGWHTRDRSGERRRRHDAPIEWTTGPGPQQLGTRVGSRGLPAGRRSARRRV